VSHVSDKEARYADFADVNGVVLNLLYTWRGTTVRCISPRVVSRKERSMHHGAKIRSSLEPGAEGAPPKGKSRTQRARLKTMTEADINFSDSSSVLHQVLY
jgi:hypothetical protein